MKPKYPEITVRLAGEDGNAFAIIGRVREALRAAKVGTAEIEAFTTETTSGDYEHLLQTCFRWVDVT